MNVPVLDKGYLASIEIWGSDERIIESARMSTGKGFLGWGPTKCPGPNCMPVEMPGDMNMCEHKPSCNNGWIPGDEKLLRTLYTKGHTTPFEMCGMTFEVKAPIFVFREWHRHRTLSYNEFSARYAELPNEFYIPSPERLAASKQSTTNKQSSEEGFGEHEQTVIIESLLTVYNVARANYERLLRNGVSREVARLVIPVAQYSRMRVSGNLQNWFRFLRLRMPKDAQFEIRQYAWGIHDMLAYYFPQSMELFREEYNAKHPTKI